MNIKKSSSLVFLCLVLLVIKLNAQEFSAKVDFSTYYGNMGTDDADVVTVDAQGNIYLGCHSNSKMLMGNNNSTHTLDGGGMDAIIIKLNSNASNIDYITSIGGNEWDAVQGIISDSQNNIYAVGTTYSINFQISNSDFQNKFGGKSDAFVVKLNSKGKVTWSIVLGGTEDEDGRDIAMDSEGNIHVIGRTASKNFPTTSKALQSQSAGGIDAFVTSIDSNGKVLSSTYFGGSGDDIGFAINVNTNNQLYIAGTTNSLNLPVKNPIQHKNNGKNDVFIAAINKDKTAINFASYLGGDEADKLYDMDIDPSGNIVIMGITSSTNFPTIKGSFQQNLNGETDIFVSKLNIKKSSLLYSTYLGGDKQDNPRSLAVDLNGNAYVVGETTSNSYPIKNGNERRNGESDALITILNNKATKLLYSTLYGGNDIENFEGITLGLDGSVTVSGLTNSTDFPLKNAIQNQFLGGRFDIVIARFTLSEKE